MQITHFFGFLRHLKRITGTNCFIFRMRRACKINCFCFSIRRIIRHRLRGKPRLHFHIRRKINICRISCIRHINRRVRLRQIQMFRIQRGIRFKFHRSRF